MNTENMWVYIHAPSGIRMYGLSVRVTESSKHLKARDLCDWTGKR
jgi:hypothetical protein